MKKKIFVTIFPPAENIHLVKDVGMIPFLLWKNHNYSSYVACYENGDYPFLSTEVSGLKIDFLKKRFSNEFLNILFYIFKNYKKIYAIQLFHFSISKLILILIFKILKLGRGKSFIKLDANEKILKLNYSKIKRFFVSKLIKSVDFVTVETKLYQIDLNTDNRLGKQVLLIPNGYYPQITNFRKKKNIFLFVGRVGDPNKAVDILLNAFADFCNKDLSWELNIIGEIDPLFDDFIVTFLKKFPDIASKIKLIGSINNRKELRDYFVDASFLIVPSYSEGFPLVFPEAINAKTIILASDSFSSSADATCNERFGGIFNVGSSKNLSEKMLQLVKNKICTDDEDYNYFREKFNWENIVDKISLLL